MLFFDIDQTLLDFKGAERLAVKQVYAELFASSSPLAFQDFYRAWCEIGAVYYQRYLQGEINFEQQRMHRVKDLVQTMGESISDQGALRVFQQYLQYFEENWRAFEDVQPCLDRMKGSRLGIITNGDHDQQRKKLKKMGILGAFEVVITSAEAGKAKPDSWIFQYACSKAKVRPEESVYVGDHLQVDILGCQASNMRGIWLNRDGTLNDTGVPVDTITSLRELRVHLD